MRHFMFAAIASAFASAVLLYGVNYGARDLEAGARAKARAAKTARGDIALLRAEKAYLARPERIEPLARALGLAPIVAAQIETASREPASR